ncbi:MAG: hypothetical protein MMC33_008499 [Icmadophila ericetorum]|nr:hypothetical protein [Icmadophila ericetorum]
MAPSREERFLMRQRGAGTRQLKDFGFNIDLSEALNAPLKPIKSGRSRRTPQPELQPQRSSRRTPIPVPKTPTQPSSKTSATRGSARPAKPPSKYTQVAPVPDAGSSSQSIRRDNTGTVTKKRKLSDVTELPVHKREGSEELLGDLPVNEESDNNGESGGIGNEASEEGLRVEKKKRKKRKSIVQGVRKRPSLGISKIIPEDIESLVEALPDSVEEPTQNDEETPHNTNFPDALPNTPSAEPVKAQRKRKKRKSIGQQAKPRRKSAIIGRVSPMRQQSSPSNDPQQTRSSSIRQQRSNHEVWSQENQAVALKVEDREDDRLIEDYQSDHEPTPTAAVQPRKSKRPAIQSPAPLVKQSETLATKDRVRKTARPSSSTAPHQIPKPRSSRPSRGPISIPVRRLSRLSVIDEEEDLPESSNAFPKKAGLTAADILSQVCEEVFAQTINSLGRVADKERDNKARDGRKRTREVVEAYQDEVNARLFQISEALDYSHTLHTRLRQAKKGKVTLVGELLSLRNERDDVALEIDEVRLNHIEASNFAQEENDIATLLQDIELAVQRGRALQPEFISDAAEVPKDAVDLEFSLEKVAAEVSSANGPGLLGQVKAFNLFLERAITAT